MKKTSAKKVTTAGKQLARKGKALRCKAGATARQLKKTVADAVSTSSHQLKKAKSTPTSRQARKVGRAVGGFLGKTIGRAEQMVTQVVKKK